MEPTPPPTFVELVPLQFTSLMFALGLVVFVCTVSMVVYWRGR